MKEKVHKVRDVDAPRATREVKGSGKYGLASGGLEGDGDVKMFENISSLQAGVLTAFREFLGNEPPGTLVKARYVDKDYAITLMGSVNTQWSEWPSSSVPGSSYEIIVPIEGFVTLKVGVFYCYKGHKDHKGERPDAWWIPHAVWLPHGTSRITLDESAKSNVRRMPQR